MTGQTDRARAQRFNADVLERRHRGDDACQHRDSHRPCGTACFVCLAAALLDTPGVDVDTATVWVPEQVEQIRLWLPVEANTEEKL